MIDEPEEFRCGTPSSDEWRKLWKSSPLDSDVSEDEYARVWEEFETKLDEAGRARFGKGYDCYLRGDNFGDRTQYLEVVNPDILRMEKLLALQSWLNDPQYTRWRIVIPTYIGKPCGIMIYPSAIVANNPSREITRADLGEIVARMKARKAKDERRG